MPRSADQVCCSSTPTATPRLSPSENEDGGLVLRRPAKNRAGTTPASAACGNAGYRPDGWGRSDRRKTPGGTVSSGIEVGRLLLRASRISGTTGGSAIDNERGAGRSGLNCSGQGGGRRERQAAVAAQSRRSTSSRGAGEPRAAARSARAGRSRRAGDAVQLAPFACRGGDDALRMLSRRSSQ